MEKIFIEVDEEEFVVIMSALDFVSTEYEIRSMYTDGCKSSDLCDEARVIFDALDDEKFKEIYARYLKNYYFDK